MEALSEVLQSVQPVIVYFLDSSLLLLRVVSKSNSKEFVHSQTVVKVIDPIGLISSQYSIAASYATLDKNKRNELHRLLLQVLPQEESSPFWKLVLMTCLLRY